ncbi:hypothetical protein Goklo_023002, partial [Gossypium klotzschianum]|nr:hypothetical protein [Gossypium klotzschianum]
AVTIAKEIGFQDICVERDTLTVIRKLIAAVEDRSCIEMEEVPRAVEELVNRDRNRDAADAQWDFVYSVKENGISDL